jgi:hypothetical protein
LALVANYCKPHILGTVTNKNSKIVYILTQCPGSGRWQTEAANSWVKSGKNKAIAWLKQQPKTTASTLEYIDSLLRSLEDGSFCSNEALTTTH